MNKCKAKPIRQRKEQRDRVNRETEELKNQSFGRNGDSEDTDDSHELTLSDIRVDTIQKAAEMALAWKGDNYDPVFLFARALKSFELTIDKRLSQQELPTAFNTWWAMARSSLPPDTDRDECLFLFLDSFKKAKTPLGSNVIQNAIARMKSSSPPPEADKYESPKLKNLVHLCFELQKLNGDGLFFLSVRDAQHAIGCKSPREVSAFLRGLESDGVIKAVERGKPGRRRATRYRYVAKNSEHSRPSVVEQASQDVPKSDFYHPQLQETLPLFSDEVQSDKKLTGSFQNELRGSKDEVPKLKRTGAETKLGI